MRFSACHCILPVTSINSNNNKIDKSTSISISIITIFIVVIINNSSSIKSKGSQSKGKCMAPGEIENSSSNKTANVFQKKLIESTNPNAIEVGSLCNVKCEGWSRECRVWSVESLIHTFCSNRHSGVAIRDPRYASRLSATKSHACHAKWHFTALKRHLLQQSRVARHDPI